MPHCPRATLSIIRVAEDRNMAPKPGTIALMGSGELTATMVEVYKELLAKLQPSPRAVFLDTPAGFQLNADLLSQKAVGYFHDRIQQSLRVISFKSRDGVALYEAEQAFHELREANFVLIGPGSPTYAVRNWDQTPVPEILTACVAKGGCLVAASAAALTVGHFTLPVYEIYKVGQDLHWEEGLQILGHFGFNLVVVPHWNNAEGGTHDTRFCYMGEARFAQLEALLPDDIAIFGLDEHTACLLDLETDEAVVKGLGRAVLRCRGAEVVFEKGERFSLELLRGGKGLKPWQPIAPQLSPEPPRPGEQQHSFWGAIHSLEASFHAALQKRDPQATISILLQLDDRLWQARQEGESDEFISQAREIWREMLVLLGTKLEVGPEDRTRYLSPLVHELIDLRERFRRERKWHEADAVRESLQRADIFVEDTRDGPRWHLEAG